MTRCVTIIRNQMFLGFRRETFILFALRGSSCLALRAAGIEREPFLLLEDCFDLRLYQAAVAPNRRKYQDFRCREPYSS
jgi:hypothetical protein